MRECVSVALDVGAKLILSRDTRCRRNDGNWVVHFRANAPANIGLELSDQAFLALVSFASGAEPAEYDDEGDSQVYREVLKRFVDAGILLPTSYKLAGERVSLPISEILRARAAIEVDRLWLLELEALLLYLMARENPFTEPVCELGSMFGGSTVMLALGCQASRHDNLVLAVDDHEWHRHRAGENLPESVVSALPTTLPDFERTIRKAGVADNIKAVVEDTVTAARAYDGRLSLLFVDSTHSLEGITQDFDAWFPKLVPGGIVAFHDYGNSRWPDIKAAVDQFRPKFSEFTCYQTLAIARKG